MTTGHGLGLPQAARPGSIDVHHHYLPPFYLERALESMERIHAATPVVRDWSPARAVETMDATGINLAVLSISTPGFEFGGKSDISLSQVATMARRLNEFARLMVCDHPGRFEIFTALPLPDVQASLEEIRHGFETLGAVGVGLLSNYGGRHLGDERFDPILDELNRRSAIVYVHPTDLPCCRGLVPGVPDTSIEYPTDTARTIASLIWAGAFARYPAIRFIFAHGAGVLPMIMSRLVRAYTAFLERTRTANAAQLYQAALDGLSRIYVDTAGIANAPALAATQAWIKSSNILYGSDHPFVNAPITIDAMGSMHLEPNVMSAIMNRNALDLFEFNKVKI